MFKNVVIAILALVVIGVGLEWWKAKQNWDNMQKYVGQVNGQLQAADLERGRAWTQLGDANNRISELEKNIQAEVKAHKGTLSLYAELKAKYDAKGGSTTVVTLPGEVVEVPATVTLNDYHYFWNSPDVGLIDIGTELPFDYEDFRLTFHGLLSSKDGKPALESEYYLHMKLEGKFVQVTLADNTLAHYFYLFEMDDQGEIVGHVQLTHFTVIAQDLRQGHFMLAPHFDMGGAPGVHDGKFYAAVSFGTSVWGYGRSENDLTWRFLRLSANVTRDSLGAGIAPVMVNVGDPLPVFSNLWIGPQYSFDNKYGMGLELVVGSVL